MNYNSEILIVIISILFSSLVGVFGYLLKTIINKLDQVDNKLQNVALDVADIKPKVNAMWEHFLKNTRL